MALPRVVFDVQDGSITFYDETTVGPINSTHVEVTWPDGIVQDLGEFLTDANSGIAEVPMRNGADGNMMTGTYSFSFDRYESGSPTGQPIEVEVGIIGLENTLSVSENINTFVPIIQLNDSTDYEKVGWDFIAVTRAWEALRGATSYASSSNPFNVYDSGYWSGSYTWGLTSRATYQSGQVDFVTEDTASGSFDVTAPKMIPEILALLNCLYAKILEKDCCRDAMYDIMVADYQMANTLLHNFILNGQADITEGQQDLLDGILARVKRYGCGDDGTVADAVLGDYDWCLCSESGGGGSDSRVFFNAGNGCWLSADTNDWTFSIASGVGTFSSPTAGSRIYAGTIRGTSAVTVYDTDKFKLVIPVAGNSANLGATSALTPVTEVYGTTGANPTDGSPWVKDAGAVETREVDISSGTVSKVFVSLGTIYPNWKIDFRNP